MKKSLKPNKEAKLTYSNGVVSVSRDEVVESSKRILTDALKGKFKKLK